MSCVCVCELGSVLVIYGVSVRMCAMLEQSILIRSENRIVQTQHVALEFPGIYTTLRNHSTAQTYMSSGRR